MPKQKKPESAYIIKPAVKHSWSEYQKNVFRNIAKGDGHTLIIAKAGASKTTVLVEGSKYIPKKTDTLFCAFSKSIQEELKSRLSDRIYCSTLHSLGFKAIRQRFGQGVILDEDKCWKIVGSFFNDEKGKFDLISNIVKAVGFCKATLTDMPAKIEQLIVKYDIEICEETTDQFIKYVIRALRECKEQTNSVDYNDMVYFPFVYKLSVGKFGYVFVDECQDMSRGMIEMALSACAPGGRIIAAGDPNQAIFSFMGADEDVFPNLRSRLSPTELELPICYRCPKRVVWLAQTIVPDIKSFDGAVDGEIIDLHVDKLMETAKPGDVVISRTNAPLIKNCLFFLRHGIPSNMLGRDFMSNLNYMIKKSKKKSVEAFLIWLDKWEKDEKQNLIAKYPNAGTDTISDKAECMRILCEDAGSLQEVSDNIKNLFKNNDRKKIVLFATTFKFKGQEADNIFVLKDTLRGGSALEENVKYVSFTRSRSKLYLVSKIHLGLHNK